MSGELIVNDTSGPKPRVGGHEFQWRAGRDLWLTDDAVAPSGLISVDANGFYTLRFDAPQFWGGTHTIRIAADLPEAPRPPADASHLWEKPETLNGEIIAYRGWNYRACVTRDGVTVRLKSRHNDFWWEGPVTTADFPPTADNESGLYAISGKAHHQDNFAQYLDDAEAWGRVGLSGVVVEGEKGFRAERATIRELWVNPDDCPEDDDPEGVARLLADRYQCDVGIAVPSFRLLK